jgi:integrase
MLDARNEKIWGTVPDHTFDELIVDYLASGSAIKRSAERDKYSAKRLYPHFTGRYLSEITVADIHAYSQARREDGAKPSTINKELHFFSAAINYANRRWNWDLRNPISGQTLKEPPGRVRWITREEADALIKTAEAERQSPHLADFIRLGLHTGMRKQEILGLTWDRVDLQNHRLYLTPDQNKSGKHRSIPINDTARQAIIHRAKFRATYCPASPWVFCDSHGKRIQNIRTSFATACRKANIENFRPHDLRHTCASWLVSSGVPLLEVAELLGHASVTTTQRYAHLAPHRVHDAVFTLDRKMAR